MRLSGLYTDSSSVSLSLLSLEGEHQASPSWVVLRKEHKLPCGFHYAWKMSATFSDLDSRDLRSSFTSDDALTGVPLDKTG